ncbi:MAG: LTA synthase family protein [Bacteriovoracaceae bacterium]
MPFSLSTFFLIELLVPLLIFFILRIYLIIQDYPTVILTIGLLIKVMCFGLINDLLTLSYFLPIVVFIQVMLPHKEKERKILPKALQTLLFIQIFFWLFIACTEIFFWKEFYSRFNFIAIDYLVYTKEVVGNIKESFNLPLILVSCALIAFIILFALRFILFRYRPKKEIKRFMWPVVLILPILFFVTPSSPISQLGLSHANEMAKNGMYELFSAFRHNQIDYNLFYKTISHDKMFSIMQTELKQADENIVFTSDKKMIRTPINPGKLLKKNVVIIVVESLSAYFIGALGNTKGISPKLDKLAEESLFFRNIYATGTRTVRGLEALTLSLPPTPGASIVRRHRNEKLMSMGSIFLKHGYDNKFIYGGHGLFDNMNYYFENNGYQIVDHTFFAKEEITFANTWGVCDQDLYNKTLKEADSSFRANKPFNFFLLTTSNHRPFTYPDGVIDIPSHTGREGAVKYTDFAIGEFIEKAKSHPWFKDTLFVVIADHSAEGRGVIDIPVNTYHIPLFIYAPEFLKPKKIDTVASQIDLVPTILSLLKMPDEHQFFGKNILTTKPEEERFFSGTYQKVGYYHQGEFVSLGPKASVSVNAYDPVRRHIGGILGKSTQVDTAIAYYQYANFLYMNDLYKGPYGDKD